MWFSVWLKSKSGNIQPYSNVSQNNIQRHIFVLLCKVNSPRWVSFYNSYQWNFAIFLSPSAFPFPFYSKRYEMELSSCFHRTQSTSYLQQADIWNDNRNKKGMICLHTTFGQKRSEWNFDEFLLNQTLASFHFSHISCIVESLSHVTTNPMLLEKGIHPNCSPKCCNSWFNGNVLYKKGMYEKNMDFYLTHKTQFLTQKSQWMNLC